ncbi:MAG: DUF3024 domain-containing protein [Candidatus Accumulibacter sp.]|uniref:DUF3024 domain-containing protein n=1 Tax=Candidatus Accumulibacter proximus TaxID=2954385 RepID=A0A935UFW2_9PROT|nr:DUF3024 domain-containing protein [Candidatus Accumulibacter proximus]
MALPVLTKRLVEIKLGAYCEKRIPHHVRDQVRLSFAIRGNSVTLNEERIAFSQPGTWVTVPIAQFRYEDNGSWGLFCSDRNSKWHRYHQAKPSRDLDTLLAALDADQTGIFWG